MVRTFPNWKTTNTRSNKCDHVQPRRASSFGRRQTFATLPCSRQSCSSSLSIPEAHRGLEQGRGTTFSLIFSITAVIYISRFLRWVFPPTCSCLAGFPRSTGRGELQTPRWHRSSPGYTERTHTVIHHELITEMKWFSGSFLLLIFLSCSVSQETTTAGSRGKSWFTKYRLSFWTTSSGLHGRMKDISLVKGHLWFTAAIFKPVRTLQSARLTSRNREMSLLSLTPMATTFSNIQKNGRSSPSLGLASLSRR